MATHAADNERTPPGTVPLIQYTAAADTDVVVLIPQPSDDPNEPLNWSMFRKGINFFLISIMAIMAFTLVTFQSIFWAQIAMDLDTTMDKLGNGNSTQLAGLALGCFFFIPFAVKYGRRPVYIFSVAFMAGGSWWTSRLSSYPELLAANFFTGLAGSINETTVQMTIADLFFVHQRGRANGIYFLAVLIGSYVTPIPAGAHGAVQGWRWSYYALSIALTILTFVFLVGFEETKYVPLTPSSSRQPRPMTSEESKDQSKVLEAGEPSHSDERKDYAASETMKSIQEVRATPAPNSYAQRMRLITKTDESFLKVLIAPFHVILFPHILFVAMIFSFSIAWLVLTVTMNSIFFASPPYNFTSAGIGYMSVGPFIGSLFGLVYGGPISDWSVKRFAMRNGGVYEPEMRLYLLMIPSIFMAGGIVMYGVTAAKGLHWIYPSIGGAIFAAGLGALGDMVFTMAIDTYRDVVAEAFVAISFLRNIGGIILPQVRPAGAAAMGYQNQFILVGGLSLAVCLLHIPMIIWGKSLRKRFAPQYYRAVEKVSER